MTHKLTLAAAFLSIFAACSHNSHDHATEGHDHEAETAQHGETDGHDEADKQPGLVEMSHDAVKGAGIVTQPVAPGEFREALKAAAVIENSRGAERVLAAPAAGIVAFRGDVVAGQPVSAGQALFTVSSKGLEQADATATLNVDVAAAKKALDRAESLIKDNLITRTEYDALRADYERAKAAAATVGARTAQAVSVSTPIPGYVVDVAVRPGQFVEMGATLATVARDRRLLLRAEVSERNRGFVPLVAGANIRLPGESEARSLAALNPKILSSGTAASGNSNFIPVYIEFDNPGGLGNGSVVEAWLLGPARTNVISVPRSALVEEGGYFYVYVKLPEEHEVFRKTEVSLGASDGERVEIISGLKPGEEVVTAGAPRIRMAGMGSAIQGHSHHH